MYIKRKVENCVCWVDENLIPEFENCINKNSTMYIMLASFVVDIENNVIVKDRINGTSREWLIESYIKMLNDGAVPYEGYNSPCIEDTQKIKYVVEYKKGKERSTFEQLEEAIKFFEKKKESSKSNPKLIRIVTTTKENTLIS